MVQGKPLGKGKTMRLVYVFNYFEPTGYLFRAPEFIARAFVRLSRGPYDYAPTASGY